MRDSELIRQVWAHGSLTWRDSKRSHRDETRVNFSRTLKRTSVNGSGFALLIWKPFLIFRPLLVGNCTWRHHILTTCALTLQPWTMSAESSPEPWMGHQPCVHACWAHAFQTSTTPLSPSKSGCSARAWTQGTAPVTPTPTLLPSTPTWLKVLGNPQGLHLKHQFRFPGNTGALEKISIHARTRSSQLENRDQEAETNSVPHTLYSRAGLGMQHRGSFQQTLLGTPYAIFHPVCFWTPVKADGLHYHGPLHMPSLRI